MAFRVGLDEDDTKEQTGQVILDLTTRMFSPSGPTHDAATTDGAPYGTVTDHSGVSTELSSIRVDGADTLRARMGEAEVSVDLGKIASLAVGQEDSLWAVEATMKSGVRSSVHVDGDVVLSGESNIGAFRIQMKNVTQVTLRADASGSQALP